MIPITSIIATADNLIPTLPDDYEDNGILHCGKCHTPKECISVWMGHEIKHKCLCRCGSEERDHDIAERRAKEYAENLERLKSVGMQDERFRNATFQTAEHSKRLLSLKKYCDAWDAMKEKNAGLLLHGSAGTGKTFAAACIANELLSHGVPVLMTNLSKVLNGLQEHYEDRNYFIRDLCKYPLLILDDFGIERNTEYAVEQIYSIIDARYRSGLPLIITTNLTEDELTNPKDISKARIYDRINEMCCIRFNFGDKGRRAAIAEKKKADAIAAIIN